MNTTTRRYPRSLREAFPFEVDYACPIERPARSVRFLSRMSRLALAIVAVMLVLTGFVMVTPADDLAEMALDDAQRAARAEARRERAEARQCIDEFGPGVSVVRDVQGRTVCVPRTLKGAM